MSYHISKTLTLPFEQAIAKVSDALKSEDFGVLTDIDVEQTLRKKLNVDFRPYRILGACNPSLAYQALQAEDKIGTLLPCNVIVQERDDGQVEVSAIDPVVSLARAGSPQLSGLAETVQAKLRKVVDSL